MPLPANQLLEEDSESGRGASLPQSPANLAVDQRAIPTPTSDTGTMRDNDAA